MTPQSGPVYRVRLWRSLHPLLPVLLAWVTALLGCSEPSKGPRVLEEYLGRLSRALDTSTVEVPLVAPPRINDAELTPLPIPAGGLGMLDFLALSGCELQVNIGRRNSSLGNTASASQQLLLDIEFLALAPSCIAFIQDEQPELAQLLETERLNKRQQLPKRLYNAILAGPEYRQFWSLPRKLEDYPDQTAGDVIDSLERLVAMSNDWLEGKYDVDYPLELDLSVLRQGDGGALLLAAATQQRQLGMGTILIEQRIATKPLCPGGRKTEAASITETVVLKYFTQDAQAWLAQLNRRQQQLVTPLATLEKMLSDVLTVNYRAWRNQRDRLLNSLSTTPKAHVSAIKNAFTSCPAPLWQVH